MESAFFGRHRFPFGRCSAPIVVAMLLGVAGATARSEPTLPVPDNVGGAQVFVDGVADRFERVREAVATARARSGRAYRVIIVDRAGSAGDARRLLDAILDRWSSDETRESGFDPAADVTILLDVNDRLLAMRAPAALEAGSGLDQATIEEELIRKVFLPRARDGLYDDGLADLVGATEAWIARVQQDEIQRIEQRRLFFQRTLPLGLATMAGVGVLGGLALQRARHARRMRVARDKLAAFKQDVVALSDLLDSQQERHRMLPHTDADFTTPMEGMTRVTYDNVQGAIRRYRERWLSLMDVWEKAQNRVDAEWALGTASADEAIRLLDSAEARPPLAEVAGECKAPLDVLEQAHEKAREYSASLAAEVTTCRGRLEALAGRGRSGGAFQATLAEVSRSGEIAAAEIERDPVASRGRLEQAAAALTTLGDMLGAVEAADDRRRKAIDETARIEALVASRRAEGWLLSEPGANPDDRLSSARSDCVLAAQLLDSGETASALAHVERAEKASGEALALLESIVAARARIDELLPGCVARLEALASRRTRTAREIERLAATYAESAWSDVADNLPKADEGLARVSRLLDEARQSADPGRQHYFRAVALLEESVRQEDWIEGCHGAVSDRLAELDDLRESLPPKRDLARRRVGELANRLERQRTDRVRANERCHEAGRLLDVADAAIAVARPDVKQAARIVEAAESAAARAEDLADEDERLASQAAHDLDETDALLRRVASWYAEGVQADVRGAVATLETARSLLSRQRYEESIKSSSEASQAGRAAYAAATAEADRRRRRRQMEIQRRQMEESFSRMSRGAGPWVIQLPGGVFTGPDPWRSLQGTGGGRPSTSPTAGAGWSRDIAQVGW